MKQTYEYHGQPFALDISQTGKSWQISIDGKTYSVELISAVAGVLELAIDGKPVRAFVSRDGTYRWVTVNGQTLQLVTTANTRKSGGQAGHAASQLTASMPGVVRAVPVAEGDHVRKGQTLAILEAMKMENKLAAPYDGLVKKLTINVGQTVERDQLLMEIEKLDEAKSDPAES